MAVDPRGLRAVPTLVVGAGYLGSAIARLCAAPPVVTRRTARRDPARPLPRGTCLIALDLDRASDRDLEARLAPLARERAVIACLARPSGATGAFYPRVAGRLVAALPASVRRLVWISSTSACPDRDGPVPEADAGAPPVGPRGAAQRAAERTVLGGCAQRGIEAVVLRLGGLVGPGRPIGGHARRANGGPLPGHGWYATNLVHLADAARLALRASVVVGVEGRVLYGVAPDHTPRRLAYARAARARGERPPAFEAPVPADRRVRGKRVLAEESARRLGHRYLHPTHVYGLR